MSDFLFSGQPLDHELVASIACLLDLADVPSLLWGNYLHTIYGVPTVVDVCHRLNLILLKASFIPCTPEFDCGLADEILDPVPAAHLHIRADLSVGLYPKSTVLLDFPSFDIHSSGAGNADVILASDPRLPSDRIGRGQGCFSELLYPVRILTPVRYCESIILLLCRDLGGNYHCYWNAMLIYVWEYVEETDIFDEESLGQCYRDWYQAFKTPDMKIWSKLNEIRKDFVKRQVLPDVDVDLSWAPG
ncbi:uncharacterized protein BO97DRAFT_436580 [Aspergillus homomorphus CBS 101889]|uniref:Uncharacterized protein n=1 Tax=Aspergillus homomorphus (strain CBS 101889) TaxID=1450537 RepID=A0A395HQW3_ASPHC|nr:hypothetical protein BO97DRAFT_436580 [Aspergillus homomorphus CBS 101889]RAL09879.1 hypothetical protein BO97DRAFT_436580 [Aspergillus homomorphus CBS 101889]